MKPIKILEFIIKEHKHIKSMPKQYWIDNPDAEEHSVEYSVSLKISSDDIDIFNTRVHDKKILQLYRGKVIKSKSEMLSYNLGECYAIIDCSIFSGEEIDTIKDDLKLYKY